MKMTMIAATAIMLSPMVGIAGEYDPVDPRTCTGRICQAASGPTLPALAVQLVNMCIQGDLETCEYLGLTATDQQTLADCINGGQDQNACKIWNKRILPE